MKTLLFIFILLMHACAPRASSGGVRNFATQGSLNSISSSDCDANGGEWSEGSCTFEIPIAEAKTPEECQVSGGVWSDTKNFCVEKIDMGATIDGVETREECLTRNGYWIGSLCYVKKEDLDTYDSGKYAYTEKECLDLSGIWSDDYCTLPSDISYEALLQNNNPCNVDSENYNEYACQMTSQSRCEASLGTWDTATLICNCEEPMSWSDLYLSCGYYDAIEVKFNDEVVLEVFNPTGEDFFPIYALEMKNEWASHNSWVLRNDVFGTLVSSWEGGSESYALTDEAEANSVDANSDDGKIEEGKCYMRFKIKNAEDPSSNEVIKDGDLITLQSVGLCEDEGHCDVYFNRETSVSIAASVGIGIGIGIASVAIIAGMVATGGALAGAVAGAASAAVVAGGAATVGATAAAATGAAAAGTAIAAGASSTAAIAIGSTAGAGVAAASAVAGGGAVTMMVLAGVGAAIGSGIAAAAIDWGHLMAHDEYIESDINLDWSKFTGSDVFKLEMYKEGEETLTVGSDPNGGSLPFYLTSVNTTHEDRDGFYIKTDDEVFMTERTDDEGGKPKMASDLKSDAQEGGPSRLRIQLCGSFCKTLEAGLTCWKD